MLGIFLDIETTGLDATRHCPIDIAFKIIDLSSGFVLNEYQSIVKQSMEAWQQRDHRSVEFNGFNYEAVAAGKDIGMINQEIVEIFSRLNIQRGNAFFICQNPAFDRAFFNQLIDIYIQEGLRWPYHWLDLASMYWAMCLSQARQGGRRAPEKISVSKNSIAQAFGLPPETCPHRAMRGVDHLLDCYKAVFGIEDWRS